MPVFHFFFSVLCNGFTALKEAADGDNSIIDLPQFLSTKLWFDSGAAEQTFLRLAI